MSKMEILKGKRGEDSKSSGESESGDEGSLDEVGIDELNA